VTDLSDYYAAQASIYRDASTIMSVIFGFIIAALAIGFSIATLPGANVTWELYILGSLAIILGSTLAILSVKTIQYDHKVAIELKAKAFPSNKK
jgi:low affinity Fe/Cu permease